MGEWTFTPIAVLYFTAAGVSFILSFLSWRLRPARGASYFCAMTSAIGVWILAYILELYNTGFLWKVSLFKVGMLALSIALYFWVLFTVNYSQFEHWIQWYIKIAIGVIPFVFIINVFIAPHPSWVFTIFSVVEIKGLSILKQHPNWGFYLWTGWAYFCIAGGMLLLFFRMFNLPSSQRVQIFILAPLILLIIIPNFLHILGWEAVEPYDPTPLAIAIAGLIFIISIYYYKFIEVMPVAHAQVFQRIPSGVIILDGQNRVLEVNPKAEQIFGVTQLKIAGTNVLKLLPQLEDKIDLSDSDNKIVSEVQVGTPLRIFEVQLDTIQNSKGVIEGRIVLLVDVTDYKIVINDLDAYARTVAHDLKNPLNIINGYAELLEYEAGDLLPEKNYNNLSSIVRTSKQMDEIIDSLLLLSQVRKSEDVTKSVIDVEACLNDAITKLENVIAQKNANIIRLNKLHYAIGQSVWIQQVWTNYISNAIKYGGEEPVILISSERKGDYYYFVVEDNGDGLTEAEGQEIFKEFDRLGRHKGKISGHGLGLSVVKRIINKLGGEVGVRKGSANGSAFYFTLPVK